MASSRKSNLTRFAFGAASAVLLTGTVVIGSTSVQSQSAGCSGDYVVNVRGGRLTSYTDASQGWATSYTFPASIPPGQYDLNGAGSDAYEGRSAAPAQPNERWFVQLIDINGNVVATSGSTGDLQDGVEAASWSGGLGLVSFDTAVGSIRTVHASQTTAETNSLNPSCVGFTALQAPTTTTTQPEPEPDPGPETTVEPETPEPEEEPERQETPTTTAPTAPAPDRPAFTG